MGRLKAVIAGAIALGLGLSKAYAEEPKCQLRKIAELPVTMVGMAPTIPVKINGKDAKLMADSGAFYSFLSAASPGMFGMETLMAPPDFLVSGVAGTVRPRLAIAKDFELANIPLKKIEFLVLGGDLYPGVAGAIGQNIFGLGDVEYDLANGVIRIVKPKGCAKAALAYWASGKSASFLKIDKLSDLSYMTVSKAQVNGKTIKVMLDSGASGSVLKRQTAEKVGIHIKSEDVDSDGLSFGIGKRLVESWISPVDTFAIGDEEIQHTRLRIGDIDLDDADMLLGADFFLSHRIYVANSQGLIYFTYNGGPVFKLERKAAANPEAAPASDSGNLDANGYARRASASMARRDYLAAEADYSRAIDLEPKVAEHVLERAKARFLLEYMDQVLQDLKAVLALNPKNTDAILMRGRVYLHEKDMAKAKDDFRQALAIEPDNPGIRLAMASLYTDAKDYAEAVAELDIWLEKFPKNGMQADVRNNRCWLLAAQNVDLDRALDDCNQAIKLRGKNSAYLDTRAFVYLRLGDLDAAIADYSAAIKLQPKEARPWYGRGLAQQKKGFVAEGAADIAEGLKLDPDVKDDFKDNGLIDDAGALRSPAR